MTADPYTAAGEPIKVSPRRQQLQVIATDDRLPPRHVMSFDGSYSS